MRITVGDAKNSRIPNALGIGPSDARFIQWLNEAQQRLIIEGRYWGTTARFNICATNGCITLPRQIASIERVNVCGNPTPVRDQWYEFLDNCFGTIESQTPSGGCCSNGGRASGMNEAIYRGHYSTFNDIIGTLKKLTFICDLASDVGKKVILLGYDGNGNWIRTTQSGVIADGEVVALAQGGGVTTTNFFSSVTDVQFTQAMDGQSWLYELNTLDSTLRMIGHYQYDEPRPNYARYYFPSVCPRPTQNGSCAYTKVEIIGKLEFIPVAKDTDYLIIGNIPALKELMVALKKAENESDSVKANTIIMAGMTLAKAILDRELEHYHGGAQFKINVEGSSLGQNDPIPNFL